MLIPPSRFALATRLAEGGGPCGSCVLVCGSVPGVRLRRLNWVPDPRHRYAGHDRTRPPAGAELCRQEIPIFITAHGDVTVRPYLLEQGAVECQFKPFSDTALLERSMPHFE